MFLKAHRSSGSTSFILKQAGRNLFVLIEYGRAIIQLGFLLTQIFSQAQNTRLHFVTST